MNYKKPPILERALVIHAQVPEERFHFAADSWAAELQPEFPESKIVSEWTLKVTEKDGMPVLDPTRQTLTLRQTFWRMKGERKDHGIQLWPDRISFNLFGSPGEPRSYEELEAFAERWIGRWARHFEVEVFERITLQYVNLLSESTLSKFVIKKSLQIGEVLKMFENIPGELHTLHPPFDFQFNMDGETAEPLSRFGAHCLALKQDSVDDVPVMHLRFTATTHIGKHSASLKKVTTEARLMHDLILRQFEAFFTDRAKATFQPCQS